MTQAEQNQNTVATNEAPYWHCRVINMKLSANRDQNIMACVSGPELVGRTSYSLTMAMSLAQFKQATRIFILSEGFEHVRLIERFKTPEVRINQWLFSSNPATVSDWERAGLTPADILYVDYPVDDDMEKYLALLSRVYRCGVVYTKSMNVETRVKLAEKDERTIDLDMRLPNSKYADVTVHLYRNTKFSPGVVLTNVAIKSTGSSGRTTLTSAFGKVMPLRLRKTKKPKPVAKLA